MCSLQTRDIARPAKTKQAQLAKMLHVGGAGHVWEGCVIFSKVRSQGPKSQDADVEFLVGVSSWNLFKRDPAQKAPDKRLGRAAAQ